MITIDAKTKQVWNAREHVPQVRSKWFPEYNVTNGYIRGWVEPNYPLPTLLGTSAIYPECVVIHTPGYLDEVPGITWWNESYGLPMPDDHGQWNPN